MSKFIHHIRQLERAERKIQKHLTRLEKQLAPLLAEKAELETLLCTTKAKKQTLQSALQIVADFQPLALGKFTHRVFKGKVKQLIIQLMKANPDRVYQVRELASEMLILDNQPDMLPDERHIEAVRKSLNKLLAKDIVTKTIEKPNVYWQWKG